MLVLIYAYICTTQNKRYLELTRKKKNISVNAIYQLLLPKATCNQTFDVTSNYMLHASTISFSFFYRH
jgi:hypothetical protein